MTLFCRNIAYFESILTQLVIGSSQSTDKEIIEREKEMVIHVLHKTTGSKSSLMISIAKSIPHFVFRITDSCNHLK